MGFRESAEQVECDKERTGPSELIGSTDNRVGGLVEGEGFAQ
jgi:hypothetical protein